MRRPRTTFAAPFVFVIGCGQPQDHVASPHRHHHHHDRVAQAVIDAGTIDEPIDASIDEPIEEPTDAAVRVPIDAVGDGVSIEEQCRKPEIYHVYCNPPRPTEGRIVRAEIQGDKVAVTVALGSDQGVTKTWKVVVVDGHGVAIAGGVGDIVRVDRRATVIVVRLSLDQVNSSGRVRLSAP